MDDAHDQLRRTDRSAERPLALGERLKACARMTLTDKRVCSMNLGYLAERINPESPLAGARAIFEEAREDFSKRQRWITLPGEEPLQTIGSTGATWLALARASGRLLDFGGNIEGSQDRAVQQLLRGTSFLPIYVPEGREQASRKALAEEYAKRIAASVADDGSLERLWRVLNEFPFTVESKHSDEPRNADDLVPLDWVDVQYPNSGTFAFASSSEELSSWAQPRVDIGVLTFRRQSSVFVLPNSVAKLFRLRCENHESCLPHDIIIESFATAGIKLRTPWSYCTLNDLLPDDLYDAEKGFGWKYASAVDFVRVRLKIVPDDQGKPRLVADFFAGDEASVVDTPGMSTGPGWALSTHAEEWVQTQAKNRNYSQTFRSIRTMFIGSDEMMVRVVFSEPLDTYDLDRDPIPVGLMDADYPWTLPDHFEQDTDTTLDWCDTADWAKTMLTTEYKFVPAFEIGTRETPFPRGSIMNALFANLLIEDSSKRVDRLVRSHATRTAEIGLAWYGSLVDDAHSLLQTIR